MLAWLLNAQLSSEAAGRACCQSVARVLDGCWPDCWMLNCQLMRQLVGQASMLGGCWHVATEFEMDACM